MFSVRHVIIALLISLHDDLLYMYNSKIKCLLRSSNQINNWKVYFHNNKCLCKTCNCLYYRVQKANDFITSATWIIKNLSWLIYVDIHVLLIFEPLYTRLPLLSQRWDKTEPNISKWKMIKSWQIYLCLRVTHKRY
jgi:hypothetical protein